MPLESEEVSQVIPEEALGCLRGCLVEGDAEQSRRERRIRRRALAISILFQSAVLATLILVPLFGKAARINLTIVTPIPPYSPYRHASHNAVAQPPHRQGVRNNCHFCAPHDISPTIVTRDHASSENDENDAPLEGLAPNIPGAGEGLIPVSDPRQGGPTPEDAKKSVEPPRLLHFTHLDPALLVHRVEPAYPPLAKQTHHEGHVELRAVIGTDGTIQSLQIVVSDPLFNQSAMEAVREWRYRPTVLNGQPVEIDTYITVIYNMPH